MTGGGEKLVASEEPWEAVNQDSSLDPKSSLPILFEKRSPRCGHPSCQHRSRAALRFANDIIEQANLSSSWTAELVAKLHEAMPATNDTDRCEQVRAALAEQIGIETCLQHPDTLEAPAASYGRRLLYRDPGGAFIVVLMIWG